jgi:hypothetical protein
MPTDLSKTDFKQILIDADIPVTDEDFQAQWDGQLVAHDFIVNNDSPLSPFWRLQKALVGKPAAQIVDILTNKIMPNSFVATAKKEWLDLKGADRKITRLKDVKAQGNIEFTRTDTASELTIPAGTIIESTPVNGVVYLLVTLFDTNFSIEQAKALALSEAFESGEKYNLAVGYYSKITPEIDGVSASNKQDWLVRNGQNIETDNNFSLRIRDQFASLGEFHVNAVYKSIIAEVSGIPIDNIIFEQTAPRGAGSANAYIFLNVGQVSQAVVDVVNNHIASGYHGQGDDLKVFAIPTQEKAVELDLWLKPNSADITADVENFIRAAFRENAGYQVTQCLPNSVFSFSLLAAELHAEFHEIATLKFTTDDISAGVWLPTISALTVMNNV